MCANFGSPEELIAAMAVLPESTAYTFHILNAHQSHCHHEYIELCEQQHVEEMRLEASSDSKDGLETAHEN